ncbi:MAG: long-chain fatty acid--CoA ligase [Chloroflexota bacterium]
MTRRTIAHMQHDRMTAQPDAPTYYYHKNDSWHPMTNAEVLEAAAEIGAGLWSLGVRHSDRVAVMSESRYEWDMIDASALDIGACVVSIYPTSTTDVTAYILEHSGSKVAFLENAERWQTAVSKLPEMTELKQVVIIDAADMPEGDWITLDQLRAKGRDLLAEQPSLISEARDAVQPDDLASLMYTSGTTGNPKGVSLTHNMLYTLLEVVLSLTETKPGDTNVIYLPMSHILQRVNVYAGRFANTVGYFSPSILEFSMTAKAANPSRMTAVPRLLEKVHARVMAGIEQAPPNRQRLIERALAVGKQRTQLVESGKSVPLLLRLQDALFERLVFSKLRATIFGTNIEFLTCGAAPISTELLEFYYAINLPVYEGYGLTETCAPITINLPDNHKIGTVGPPLPGSEVKIAEDGEILLKGPSVFNSYFDNPEATAASFTEDGWFKSGDIGELDADGFLRITDRKKFIIITAAGKNIAPAPIEQKLLQHPLIGQVVVHGDKRNFLSALLTLDPETLAVWAEQNGKAGVDLAELSTDPQLVAEINQFVEAVNSKLARYETIKRFHILPEEFTTANGYLTPSMKIKRKVVETDFAGVLDGMYAG